jgi:phage tail sheath protein FI
VSSLWAPWITIPGLTSGTTRTVPPSCIVAARMSFNDQSGVPVDQPSAGIFGISPSAIQAKFDFPVAADRDTLNANGVNLLRTFFDGVRIYGYRTLADPTADPNWLLLSNARLFMKIQADVDAVMERYVFRILDGQRLTISEFGGAVTGILLPYWQRGELFGVTPDEAFRVDVGDTINTDVTMANGELHVTVTVKTSPFAEEVDLELVKTRITEAV